MSYLYLSLVAAFLIVAWFYWLGTKTEFLGGDDEDQQEKCLICGGEMNVGDYIEQTFTGTLDFACDKYPVTMSPGGPGRLIKNGCFKCSQCGFSLRHYG